MILNDRNVPKLELQKGKKKRFIYDEHRSAPKGFSVRLTARKDKECARAYVLWYTHNGIQHSEAIGRCCDIAIDKARTSAHELLNLRKEKGVLSKNSLQDAKATISTLMPAFLELKKRGRSFKEIKGYMERDFLPVMGNYKPSDITRQLIRELVSKKAKKTPTAGAHLLAYIKVFFEYCVDEGVLGANPAKGASIPKELRRVGTRKRVLSQNEIRGFWEYQDSFKMHRLLHIALKLILVTGQRPSEVAGMHENEIVDGIWTIPASRRGKTKTSNTVPLTDTALALIEEAKIYSEGEAGYIFEIQKDKHIDVGSLSKSVLQSITALRNQPDEELEHWKPHDLRRTLRTGLQECRVPLDIAEMVLGHSRGVIERTYATSDVIDQRKSALEAWERRLLAILGNKSNKEIKEAGQYVYADASYRQLLEELSSLRKQVAEKPQDSVHAR